MLGEIVLVGSCPRGSCPDTVSFTWLHAFPISVVLLNQSQKDFPYEFNNNTTLTPIHSSIIIQIYAVAHCLVCFVLSLVSPTVVYNLCVTQL